MIPAEESYFEGTLIIPFDVAADLPAPDIIPLVIEFLTPRQADLDLDAALFEIYFERHESISFLLDLSAQFQDFPFV